MKKIFCFMMIIMILPITGKITASSSKDYTSYPEINLSKGKLIRHWTNSDIGRYKLMVSRRRFAGWSTYVVNKEVEATFESEILFSFVNNGTTEIDYSKVITYDKNSKTSISCTGNIGYKTSGTLKKFKHNLDASVNISYSNTTTEDKKETDTLKMKIDPGYKAIIYMTGTARVTNGFAIRYLFWCRQQTGSFEYFTVTNLYPHIKKVKA